jgi:hypothetical protein
VSRPGSPNGNSAPGRKPANDGGKHEPGWADGLRKLYDSVVDEPLPDSFEDLLKKLDKDSDGGD